MLNNKTFYPTPDDLIDRMLAKIKNTPTTVLDPQAGDGAIVERMKAYYKPADTEDEDDRRNHHFWRKFEHCDYSCIEIDETLQAVLRGKRFKILDTDFLKYSGPDKFDLIIMNPPFDTGDLHLLKALEIMYRGEISCVLNAETLRNPYSNIRKELGKKLRDLNAEIEYVQNAFMDAERPTGVEIALVYINIKRQVEEDLFADANDTTTKVEPDLREKYEVSTGKTIEELVLEYNQIVEIGTETIVGYYKNYRKIWKYIGLNKEVERHATSHKDMTAKMQSQLNEMLRVIRVDFWRRTLDIPDVKSRMTTKKRNEFESQIQERSQMDFTESNIRQFAINLIKNYEQMMVDAVLEIFDLFTIKHCYSGNVVEENIHYFSGWKTNKAFKIAKKVIVPVGYLDKFCGPFTDYSGKWRADYKVGEATRDIDLVISYFDAEPSYLSIAQAVGQCLEKQQSSRIDSTFFTSTVFKKGTIHLTFKDEDVLRRFNTVACKGKNWLPCDYGDKPYRDCSEKEKEVIHSFEGAASYIKNFGGQLFAKKDLLQIAA